MKVTIYNLSPPLAGSRQNAGQFTKKKRAFTLIELLVVCTIIAVLAVVAVIGYKDAKSRSRDAKRMADLSSINSAIQMYYDYNKKYPDYPASCATTSYVWSSNTKNKYSGGACVNSIFIVGLYPDYISKLPADPGPPTDADPTQNVRAYMYRVNAASNWTDYKILALAPENPNSAKEIDDPRQSGSGWSYWSLGGKDY